MSSFLRLLMIRKLRFKPRENASMQVVFVLPCLALPCPALLCRCPSSASRPECLTKTRRVRRFDGHIPSLHIVCIMIIMARYIAFDRKHLPCTHEIALRASVCVCAYPTGLVNPHGPLRQCAHCAIRTKHTLHRLKPIVSPTGGFLTFPLPVLLWRALNWGFSAAHP
jgi:hypothetical protein